MLAPAPQPLCMPGQASTHPASEQCSWEEKGSHRTLLAHGNDQTQQILRHLLYVCPFTQQPVHIHTLEVYVCLCELQTSLPELCTVPEHPRLSADKSVSVAGFEQGVSCCPPLGLPVLVLIQANLHEFCLGVRAAQSSLHRAAWLSAEELSLPPDPWA